jgi:hypothetical protein
VIPTDAEMAAFRRLVAHARDLPVDEVRAEAAPLGVEVEGLEVDGRPCVMIQDHARGWGTVVVDPESVGPIIEVPHPGFDLGTPQLGWEAFRAFDGSALVVAGATRGNRSEKSPDIPVVHRALPSGYDPYRHAEGVPDYSVSDPTHARRTMFQAAHQALTGSPSAPVVLQVHGFSALKHHGENPAFPADEQIVLTDCADDGWMAPHAREAQAALQRAGFRSHLVTFEDDASSRLGGLPNVQRRDMAERGVAPYGPPAGDAPRAEFVHMEVDTSVRRAADRDAQYARLIDVLRPVFGCAPSASRAS